MLRIEPLGKQHDRKQFDCGSEALNNYLRKTARQHNEKGVSRTYVLVDEQSPSNILGCLSLTLCEIHAQVLPEQFAKKFPTTVPAAKLGRLAIAKAQQRRGLGEMLLLFAMERAYTVFKQMGIVGFIVEAKNKYAAEYYRQYGFIPFPSNSLTLYLPMQLIKQAFEKKD